jgi:N-acetylglutamate synthase-like GNAT family acetyltransferase
LGNLDVYYSSMFETRAFNPATDFPALVELLNAAAKKDGITLTTESEQREQVALYEKYGQFQQWIIEYQQNAKLFTAYANLFKQPDTPYAEFALAVHPDFVGENVEAQLLETIEQAARQQQAAYLSALIDSRNQQLHNVLLHQGFKPEGGFRLMKMSLTESLPKPEFPAQLSLRTFDQVNDMKVMIEISNRGWSDLPGHKVASEDQIYWVNQQPHDSIFLLFDKDSKVIGCTSAKVTEDGRGNVDAPALVPEYRQPELYRALVLVGLDYIVRQGCTEASLNSWGDYDSTIAAYTELGFKTTVHELGYRLDLG